MFPFDLFGTRSDLSASSLPHWSGGSSKQVDGDIGLERFASLPGAEPAEISAAGLTTSDLSQ